MALQLTSAGVALGVLIDSITYERKIDDPGTCTFTVPDSVAYSLSQLQVIQVTDTVTSTLLYTGYIDNVADTALVGNTGTRMRVITCKDNRWLADKRIWPGPEFDGWVAGDVAAELHRVVLASEGITASYALRHDMDNTSFGAGTLTNTVAANNILTLAASGTDFTKTESVTADFATGTLSSVTAGSNALALSSFSAIKYSGSVGANLDGNTLYAKRKIWAGTSYTIVSGDQVWFDVWIDSRSPEIKVSVDLMYSNGTFCSEVDPTQLQDQFNIETLPATDLKGWADDQWFSRTCIVGPNMVGKVIVGVYLVLAGTKGGDYTAYFKNIKITNSGGTTQRTFFSSTMNSNVPASSAGYFNLAAKVVTAYAETGNRVSPSRSLSGVGVVRGSVLSWAEIDSVEPTGAASSYPPQVFIEASVDGGATYATCTNHAAIPGLLAGMNTSTLGVLLRQTLSVGGPDPTKTPLLDTCSFTVYNAAACTKTDFSDIDNTQTALGTGTLTNCTSYTNGLMTTGIYRDWTVTGSSDAPSYASQTLFGVTGATLAGPSQGEAEDRFFLRTDDGYECRSRFDFAGINAWQNFIAELDVEVPLVSNSAFGFCYRTTGWQNANDTYAYMVDLTSTSVRFGRGTNTSTGAGGYTLITAPSVVLTVGQYYRLKVVVTGTTHAAYLNDVLIYSVTDATYSAAGSVGVRLFQSAGDGNRHSSHFDNFGIVGYESDLISVSTRVTPSLSLSGIVGNSRVNWNASVPSTSTLLVESTVDGGTTWSTCTNGAQIPLLVPGFNAAGKSVKFRFTMTNQAINLPVIITGYSAFVVGQYSATGTRVSPVLACDNAGTIGSSSVTWADSAPPNTSVVVAGSTDNITYTTIAASGNPIAGLLAQGAMIADDFDVNSAANYTATFWSGGVLPVFTVDTANSRMQVTSGTNGIILWNTAQFPAAADVYLEVITNQSDAGGLVWRYTSVDNCYYATLRDSSSGTNPNTINVRKRVAAADSQILAPTTLPVTFNRGEYHTLKVTMAGTLITLLFDGLQVASFTDAGLTAAGQVGLRQNSATTSNWYSLRAQALGASAVGKTVYTKTTLTSTDPSVGPNVSSLVTSVRGPDLMTGAIINATDFAYKNTVGACLKNIADQSKFYSRLDKNKKLVMRDRAYNTAPWPLYSADPLFRISAGYPLATRQSPLYRNRHYVYNCIDLQTISEEKIGDGTAQSWVLKYPVDSLASLTLDGNPQTWGVQGVDTGKNFYYQPGQPTLSQDSSGTPPNTTQTIAITYIARVPYVAMKESAAQQTALAAIDGTSGIIGAAEDGGGISKAAGDTLAQARIDAYAILATDWEYITQRSGLDPGMLQTVFVPEHGLVDVDMLITNIITTLWLDAQGNLNYEYDVKATSGPNIGTWQRVFVQ